MFDSFYRIKICNNVCVIQNKNGFDIRKNHNRHDQTPFEFTRGSYNLFTYLDNASYGFKIFCRERLGPEHLLSGNPSATSFLCNEKELKDLFYIQHYLSLKNLMPKVLKIVSCDVNGVECRAFITERAIELPKALLRGFRKKLLNSGYLFNIWNSQEHMVEIEKIK